MANFNIKWDQVGEKVYETGVDRVVLYPQSSTGTYPKGYAWNGITGVTESPSGAEPTKLWANNHVYGQLMSAEEFGCTIEAYMYPDEFSECDGSAGIENVKGVKIRQQKRKTFGFTYRTLLGNDTDGTAYGYTIHIVYGCLAARSEGSNATVNDSPEAKTMSWEVSTTPVDMTGFEPTAHIEIDSTTANPEKLAALEQILYGKAPTSDEAHDGIEARLPLPDELVELMKEAA